jgi:hypothetical protein
MLTIRADWKTRERILRETVTLDEYGGKRLDFEKIVPIGDVSDWYNARIEKWGTKWNSVDCVIGSAEDDPLEIDMMTAWSPPCPVVRALVETYHRAAILEYAERGMAFRGKYACRWVVNRVAVDVDERRDMTEADFRELGYTA